MALSENHSEHINNSCCHVGDRAFTSKQRKARKQRLNIHVRSVAQQKISKQTWQERSEAEIRFCFTEKEKKNNVGKL